MQPNDLRALAADAVTSRETFGPQDGDVVVVRQDGPAVRYTVQQHPATAQFSASVQADAVRMAEAFAQAHAVDVWYSEDGTTHRLLRKYRPGGP